MSLLLAWRNIWRQPRRTWLTTGAMIFSNVLLVFMISIQFGMYQVLIENNLKIFTGHLQIQASGYNDEPRMHKSLPNITSLADSVRRQLNSSLVAARAEGFALVSSEERSYAVQVVGVQPAFEPLVSSLPGLIKQGRYLNDNHGAEVVVGSALARNLKLDIGDELTLMGTGRDGSFAADVVTLVGIFESGVSEVDRQFMQMPLGRFQEMFSMNGQGHSVVILSNDFHQLDKLEVSLSALMAERPSAVLLDWNELLPGLQQSIDADMISAWFMYAVLVVLVSFSVLNTQLMSVLERTREFGIVMALGLTPSQLSRLVILEALLMAAIGLVIGVGIGALIVLYFSSQGFSVPGMEAAMAQYNLPGRLYPSLDWLPLLLGPVTVFVGCILASIYPAMRLYMLQPVAAMRSA